VSGKGEGDLRCSSLLTVCQNRLGLSEDEETRLDIAQRLEREPVDSRVDVIPGVFTVADSRSESMEGSSKPGVGWRRRLLSLVMAGAYLSSKGDRVVLYAINRESTDLGGCVIRRDALTLLVGRQERHPACKMYGGWWIWAWVSPDGVAPSRMVSVSASVN